MMMVVIESDYVIKLSAPTTPMRPDWVFLVYLLLFDR